MGIHPIYLSYIVITTVSCGVLILNVILGVLIRFKIPKYWNPIGVLVGYLVFPIFKVFICIFAIAKRKEKEIEEVVEDDVSVFGPAKIVDYRTEFRTKNVTKQRKVRKPKYRTVTIERMEIVEIPKEETYNVMEWTDEPYQEQVSQVKIESYIDYEYQTTYETKRELRPDYYKPGEYYWHEEKVPLTQLVQVTRAKQVPETKYETKYNRVWKNVEKTRKLPPEYKKIPKTYTETIQDGYEYVTEDYIAKQHIPMQIPIWDAKIIGTKRGKVRRPKTIKVSAIPEIWNYLNDYFDLFSILNSFACSFFLGLLLVGVQTWFIVSYKIILYTTIAIAVITTITIIHLWIGFASTSYEHNLHIRSDLACFCNPCVTLLRFDRSTDYVGSDGYYSTF